MSVAAPLQRARCRSNNAKFTRPKHDSKTPSVLEPPKASKRRHVAVDFQLLTVDSPHSASMYLPHLVRPLIFINVDILGVDNISLLLVAARSAAGLALM